MIWTLCDTIRKFEDLNVHFESLGIEITSWAIFKDQQYILLKFYFDDIHYAFAMGVHLATEVDRENSLGSLIFSHGPLFGSWTELREGVGFISFVWYVSFNVGNHIIIHDKRLGSFVYIV